MFKVGDKVRLTTQGADLHNSLLAMMEGVDTSPCVAGDVSTVVEVDDDGDVAVDFPSCPVKSTEGKGNGTGAWWFGTGLVEQASTTH